MTLESPATSGPDPLIGRHLDGRYFVEALVARGGMATVYRGVDTRLDRTVAIKVMHASFAADPAFVERFGREARAAARLSNPHVVPVHDQGNDSGVMYLVMEFIPGHTVRDVLRTHGPLLPAQALAVVDPVLEALAAAHRAGYIHRDIKPENVLISEDGRVMVTDFGLARAIQTTEAPVTGGILLGTVAYLSPEQVEEQPTDARSDVYGAGILLYELVTGSVPYTAQGPMQVAYKHVHEQVPAPSASQSGIPPGIDRIVLRATRRHPDERYQNAVEFLAETRALRAELPPAVPWAPVPRDTLVVPTGSAVAAGALVGSAGPGRSGPWPAGPPVGGSSVPPQHGSGPGWYEQPTTVTHQTSPDDKPTRVRRGRWGLWLAAMALISGVALAVLVFGPFLRVQVPDVIGQTPEQASAVLATVNLQLEAGQSDFSEDVARGLIMTTSPGPEGSARNGSTVSAVVSKGPERYDVPDLEGLTVEEAQVALGAANLILGTQTQEHHDKVKADRIISTSPEAAASVKRDTAVAVVVSQGPAPVVLPVLQGSAGDAAEQSLEELGLKVDRKEQYSESVAKGQVVSMAPPAGTIVHRGDEVTIVVSKGPPMVTVPNVFGKSKDSAIAAIEGAGLQATVNYPLGFAALNIVQSQSPKGGTQAAKGSSVRIDVV